MISDSLGGDQLSAGLHLSFYLILKYRFKEPEMINGSEAV